jgi:hypothetical protein
VLLHHIFFRLSSFVLPLLTVCLRPFAGLYRFYRRMIAIFVGINGLRRIRAICILGRAIFASVALAIILRCFVRARADQHCC